MVKRFRGTADHKVDAKGRVSIPASFRRALEEGDPDWSDGENPKCVLVYGVSGGAYLTGYSISSIEEIEDVIESYPPLSREREYLEMILDGESADVSVDDNGRIVLPQGLRDMAGIEKQAYFVGKGKSFQIWKREDYERHARELRTWGDAQGGVGELMSRARRGE